jgi:hypothetical protein
MIGWKIDSPFHSRRNINNLDLQTATRGKHSLHRTRARARLQPTAIYHRLWRRLNLLTLAHVRTPVTGGGYLHVVGVAGVMIKGCTTILIFNVETHSSVGKTRYDGVIQYC